MSDQSEQARAIASHTEVAAPSQADQGKRRQRFGRRALMLGAAAAGAGAAASIAGGSAADAAPDGSAAVLLGKNNSTKSTTQVITRGGDGLKGQTYANNHSGVTGFDTSKGDQGHGVYGRSTNGIGVLGISDHSTGVVGQTATPGKSGVAGIDMTSGSGGHGVFGQSSKGDAMFATSENGNAMHCTSPKGTALLVEGKAKFSNSGVSNVSNGHTTATVSHSGVTSASIVLATIQKPASGVYIEGVETSNGSFTITLNKAPSTVVPVGWFILG
ncbi:MAG TPA: hypothetical protein VMR14_00220 [Streptosporangiaceae bacterium]|jgi:hypothetical protein|nr:hypothetical protein [Streptosporangiaceae bacterium]